MDQSYQPLELKSLAEDGFFKDLHAHIPWSAVRVIASSLARSKRPRGHRCLCFSHTRRIEPVGIGTVTETPQGLWVKGKLLFSIPSRAGKPMRASRRAS